MFIALFAPVFPSVLEPQARPVSATVIFGGDMMFDRYIRQITDTVGGDYLFSCIDPVLFGADLVVANLEGPITDSPPSSEPLTFTFPPETAALLARHNIGMVNLGNNHILNFGAAGKESTESYLRTAGVRFFGPGIATTTVNGIPLAFINYNEFSAASSYASVLQNTSIVREEGYVPIVYAHWGEEYSSTTARQRELAHQFVDAGAAIVIGSHPHVVQEHELYKRKNIYYSLGNFIFDQYFSPEVRRGLLLRLTVTPTGVSGIEELPVELLSDGRTCLVQQ